ncbi:hypothetical protein [Serratia quinivorans]|uniref:hypothetical protein n=1 Tax=Serratia quinivorans TaxID=137545 RepID=UPI003F72FB38
MDKLHEESRVQFEAWRKKFIGVMVNLDRDHKTGHYVCIGTWTAWKAWEAARAGIVVELPFNDIQSDETDELWDRAVESCAESIRSIGLLIKGE